MDVLPASYVEGKKKEKRRNIYPLKKILFTLPKVSCAACFKDSRYFWSLFGR